MTGSWNIPEIYTPLKDDPPTANPPPTSHQPVADQSQSISNKSTINPQPIATLSPTCRRFLWTALAHQSPTSPQLVGNWMQTD